MARSRSTSLWVVAVAPIIYLAGCGISPERGLVSVSVTPAAASAHDFPNGQVQFTAVGSFNRPPSPQTLTEAIWVVSPPPNPQDAISISQSGIAQCKAGFVGTVTIMGGQDRCPRNSTDACVLVHGNAQLTCP